MQKHLDISTIRHAGQDGSGPDKSTATPLPYTQMGTPSSIASFLATLVAEARAELGLPPTPPPTPTLDSIIAATAARARAELAADAREIERGNNALGIDFDFVRRIGFADESAIERAYRTGIIGADVVSTVGVRNTLTPCPYREPDIAGDGDTFDAMPRSGIYACLYPGRDKARIVLSARGGSFRIDLACEDSEGDCPPCRQHWIDSAANRLRHGLIGDTQLVITATGCQTPEATQKVITAIGRQLGPVRRCQVLTRSPQYTYAAHIVVTGAMPLRATLDAIAARPGVSAEYRAVSESDFKALLHSRSKMDGKRCPVRFLHWPTATTADAATTTYAHNDGYIADAKDVRKIPAVVYARRRSLKIPESQRVRIRENEAATNAGIWLSGVDLDLIELLKLRDARREGIRAKNDWQTCIVAGAYDGPKALIRDLAAVLDDNGMVSFTERKAMRQAATYIRGEIMSKSETPNTYTSGRGVVYTLAEHGAEILVVIEGTAGRAKITVGPGNRWAVVSGSAGLDRYDFANVDFPTLWEAMEYTDRRLSDAVGRIEAERILAEQSQLDRVAWLAQQWDDAKDYLTNG